MAFPNPSRELSVFTMVGRRYAVVVVVVLGLTEIINTTKQQPGGAEIENCTSQDKINTDCSLYRNV